jgi:hypothetical protein
LREGSKETIAASTRKFTMIGESLRPRGFQEAEINPDRSYNGCTL